MVETANSVMKSLTGSHVLSRLDSTEETQILYKAITHNCKPTVERGVGNRRTGGFDGAALPDRFKNNNGLRGFR